LDTEFEMQLRADLATAADGAPALSPPEITPEPSRRGWVGVCLVAAAVTVVGGIVWVTRDGSSREEGSCPSYADFQGKRYGPRGEDLRLPKAGEVVGQVTHRACEEEDAWTSEAYRLPGVDPSVALIVDDGVWLAEDANGADFLAYDQPVRCHGSDQTLRGDFVSLPGPPPEHDGEIPPTYTAVVKAYDGTGLHLDRYEWVMVRVRVTPDTVGGDAPALVTDSLQGPDWVEADVACTPDGRFVARRIAVVPAVS
jgi:hypothetical protein